MAALKRDRRDRNKLRFGIYEVGDNKVFVTQVDPLDGFREVEANAICNFMVRNLGKVVVKIELGSRVIYPAALTALVNESVDVTSDTIFVVKGELSHE